MAKAANWALTDAEARKCGEQTGLDTLVAVSYTHLDVYKRQLLYCPFIRSSPVFENLKRATILCCSFS